MKAITVAVQTWKRFMFSAIFWAPIYGAVAFLLVFIIFSPSVSQAEPPNIAVIAPSISTSTEAQRIVKTQGWKESSLWAADVILVVCRSGISGMNGPLQSSYESMRDLNRDVRLQSNDSGLNFHIYIFQINKDSSFSATKHTYYPANNPHRPPGE